MTPIELHRLAGALATLRPDWPPASLQTFLERHLQHRPLRDAALALVACALDPDTATPKRVLEPGPWWQTITSRDTPTARDTCPDHPTAATRIDPRTGDTWCADCWTNANAAPYEHPARPGVPPTDQQREQLHAAIRRPATRPDPADDGGRPLSGGTVTA